MMKMEKSEVPFYEKAEGTKKFSEKNYEEAIKHYSKVIKLINIFSLGFTCNAISIKRSS